MDSVKVREAWVRISQWYRQVRGAHAPPTKEALDDLKEERAELYRCRPPEGLRVPIRVQQSYIKDCIPTEAEVAASVRGLKVVRAGGVALGMCAEDLKGWLWECRSASCDGKDVIANLWSP